MTKKQTTSVATATIYNTSLKTKSQLREEGDAALKKFLKSGGVIEVAKPRKNPKSKMSCKNSRGFTTGTSGFANGFPKRTFGG